MAALESFPKVQKTLSLRSVDIEVLKEDLYEFGEVVSKSFDEESEIALHKQKGMTLYVYAPHALKKAIFSWSSSATKILL